MRFSTEKCQKFDGDESLPGENRSSRTANRATGDAEGRLSRGIFWNCGTLGADLSTSDAKLGVTEYVSLDACQ
jgi:hypothetical protein